MTRTCRICGGADGRYWVETPVEKYAGKTFVQLMTELTKIEVPRLVLWFNRSIWISLTGVCTFERQVSAVALC